jgi:hypothetical protein
MNEKMNLNNAPLPDLRITEVIGHFFKMAYNGYGYV